nr:ComEC/Rec2 family competence protein [Shewanella sp. WXL01]
MNRFIIGYCTCCFSALLWPQILPLQWIVLWLLIGGMCFKKAPFISGIMMSLSWLSIVFHGFYSHQTTAKPTQQIFRAEIVSLVNQNRDWISVDVKNLEQTSASKLQGYYRLNWNSAPDVKPGQVWQFSARMKSISAIANQGGFNQQKYFISRHIIGRGSVRRAELIQDNPALVHQFKSDLVVVLSKLANGDVLQALLLGQKTALSDERWRHLRQTGSGHLIAISGLHLSVVFGLFWVIFSKLCKPLAQHNYFAYRAVTLLLPLVMAFIYGYLAGFPVATTRAIIMLIMVVVLSVFNQHASVWDRLLYALFAVLVIDPFAILSSGFYLSFCALAIILLVGTGRGAEMRSTLESDKQLDQASVTNPTNLAASENAHVIWRKVKHYGMALWAIQWRLALVLAAVQALLFSTVSVHSMWLNMLFVPWFSLLVIPVAILTLCVWAMFWFINLLGIRIFGHDLVSWHESAELFEIADALLMPFSALLHYSDYLPYALLTVSERQAGLLVLILVIAVSGYLIKQLLLSQLAIPWISLARQQLFTAVRRLYSRKTLGVAAVLVGSAGMLLAFILTNTLPILVAAEPAIKSNLSDKLESGEYKLSPSVNSKLHPSEFIAESKPFSDWQLHALDVGQGSALVFEIGGQAIIYDTGAKYGDSFTYADRVIVPFLNARGLGHVSHIFISHNDNDHAGGLARLAKLYPQAKIIADDESIKADFGKRVSPCSGFNWQFAQLTFSALQTPLMAAGENDSDNNRSCVLLLDDGSSKLLLTGDIETERERGLLANQQIQNVDIMFVPHHGSRTSSTSEFINHTHPKLAVVNAGFANQYGFPKEDVMQRYQSIGAKTFVTGELGQISFNFNQGGYQVSSYRQQMSPFWYNRLFKFGEKVKAE